MEACCRSVLDPSHETRPRPFSLIICTSKLSQMNAIVFESGGGLAVQALQLLLERRSFRRRGLCPDETWERRNGPASSKLSAAASSSALASSSPMSALSLLIFSSRGV